VDFLAVATGLAGEATRLAAEAEAEPLFQINLFQVIIAATQLRGLPGDHLGRSPSSRSTDAGRAQGADRGRAARRRAGGAQGPRIGRGRAPGRDPGGRREANDILARAQKVADESRERDLAATREELERLRTRAPPTSRPRSSAAIGELRSEVADLASRRPAAWSARR
jgi:hypothetical protein